jgi:molecular chaperone DnaK
MSRAVGIDLGTTNSVIAVLRRRRPNRRRQRRGGPHHAVDRLVPKTARSSSARSPSARPSPTPTAQSARSSATWATDWTIEVDDKTYTAQEISARILMKLKRDAESYLGDTVTDAVITVPPTSTTPSVRPPRRPARSPGSTCSASSTSRPRPHSPTGWTRKSDETILVFDLGGGTFDVSSSRSATVSSRSRRPAVTPTSGGDDWDQAVIDGWSRLQATTTESTSR